MGLNPFLSQKITHFVLPESTLSVLHCLRRKLCVFCPCDQFSSEALRSLPCPMDEEIPLYDSRRATDNEQM